MLAERCSTIRACEPCKRRRRLCNGQRPCGHCTDTGMECVYSVVSDHPRSVFTTSNARRLSSGSACETCRRRKTKCDGSTPCAFCASNGLECVNNSERRKRAMVVPLGDNEAMDRIEDRLRRIEKLMTAFTPMQFRKLSSPHPPSRPTPVRQHRHSVQGISVAKEQAELLTAYATRKGGKCMPPDEATTGRSSLGITRRNQPSFLPNTLQQNLNNVLFCSVLLGCVFIEQLSKRTFASTALDYPVTQYPIYPLTSPPNQTRTASFTHSDVGQ
ncbi:hypothetical protein BDF14DRAFT_1722706 [Spinellus fusiger]|nr:hypothetical protein BDF14DRAFT_1722706 [Spinellus fusiger]